MKCWQWDDHKSITLTRYVVALAILGSAVMTVCGPWLVRWLMTTHHLNQDGPAVEVVLLVLGYLCAALAFWMLYNLYRFLGRLEQGEVFVPQTVLALRRISWCCTWAAVLCLPVGIWIYLPFAFLAVAAGFMALLVRVLKNAFAQAVRMKDELDYTI
ncbi:DUF2975 domain-containing protein [uncultured Subdoligranulum sp.]|uniref:DUF2975 domain-containing protein n=1 Tax=uncultured Subdoligranulum sp. TaxID=512298 RepID=UPI0032087633